MRRAYIHVVKHSNRLRVLRAERRITQLDVAEKADLHHHTYWRIENGYNAPTDVQKRRIARILKCTVDEAFPPREGVTS